MEWYKYLTAYPKMNPIKDGMSKVKYNFFSLSVMMVK